MHKFNFNFKLPGSAKLQVFTLGTTALAVCAGLAFAQSGEITPGSVEIDTNANLVDDDNGGENGGAVDWVLDDTEPNTGTGCLGEDGVAECNEGNITAHPDGVGLWNGVHVVDGAGTSENDVFKGGSKLADPLSWTVGSGSVGSSKYDASQAYLANNPEYLYFGLERVGNNGTTTWRIEFNKNKPPDGEKYIPDRSDGDKRFVFDVSGSGSSGSVDVFLSEWNESEGQFDPLPLPMGTVATINTTPVAAGPWGFRDSKGAWALGDLAKFTFAEIGLRIGPGGIQLPVDEADCSQKAYVGIQTSASNEETSAMKDAMPIFEYQLSGVTVTAMKTAESAEDLNVTITGVASGNPDKQWQVFNTQDSIWEDIPGATGPTLVFPTAGIDWTEQYTTATTINSPFEVAGDPYIGQVLSSRVRLSVSQTVAGATCTVDSNAVTVKKLVAVDP